MANVIKKIKIKQQDGTFTDYIPIGAEAENVNVDGESVKEKLNKMPYYYNSVADMKADESLKAGDMVVTLGYYEANDGGAGEYRIISGTYTDDGGSIHELDNGLYAELIIKNELNSKQFGIIDNYDITTKLQAFFNYGYNHLEKELKFLGGNYNVSNTININPNIKIKLVGDVKIVDDNEQEVTFNIISDTTDPANRTQVVCYLFDNSNGSLTLINNKTNINKIGISINSVESQSSLALNTSLKGINIRSYQIGLSLNTFNMYNLELEKMVFFNCNVGLYFGKNASVINSGENISVKKCVFTRNDCCVRLDTSIRVDFIQTSFDFNSVVTYIPTTNANITYTRCWFEGVGLKINNELSYYNEKCGLIWAADSSRWYDKNNIVIDNCEICYLKGKHPSQSIYGNTIDLILINNMFWYAEDIFAQSTIGEESFNSIFLTHNIKNVVSKNNQYKYTSHPFINKKLSLFDGLLDNEETTNEYSNINAIDNNYFENFDIVSIGTTSTKIRKVTIDNKKCIELTPPYSGAASKIKLISKKYYPINGATKISMNSALKGFKSNDMTRVTFAIVLYDKDLNELDTVSAGSTWRTSLTGIDPLKFIQTYRMIDYNLFDIPKDAVYIRPVFELFALNGVFSDTEIAGTTVHATDPVYFTGMWTFLE